MKILEVVLKPRIRSKGKASGRSGKRSIREYVSIYRRPVMHLGVTESMPIPLRGATQPLEPFEPL